MLFKKKIAELQEEPEFQWSKQRITYAVDRQGSPDVKLTVGNVPLDYDLWKGLRNPAVIGLYPAGLNEIWMFHANRRKKKVDEAGRQTIFQVPRSFEYAKKNFNRAVILSVMLPFSPKIIRDYSDIILSGKVGSSHLFSRMYEDVNLMINKATSRVAIELINNDNMALSLDNKTVNNISEEAMPVTHQKESHGPSKGGNYPQKSLAALLGLGQFGVSRLVFRDEIVDKNVERFMGPLRSIVVFDNEELVNDGDGGVIFPTDEWRSFLFQLYDFTNIDPEVNKYRFCSYIPYDDEGCGKCVKSCPSGAQANSVPAVNGEYSEEVSKQDHRFWEQKLQFDFGRCCEDRGQMAGLFPEWSCAMCASVCASKGKRRVESVERFYEKMGELTRN
jgi:hypothetical protein